MKRWAQIRGLEDAFGARWLRSGFVTWAGQQNSGHRCTPALNRSVLASAFRCQGSRRQRVWPHLLRMKSATPIIFFFLTSSISNIFRW